MNFLEDIKPKLDLCMHQPAYTEIEPNANTTKKVNIDSPQLNLHLEGSKKYRNIKIHPFATMG